MPDMEPPKKIPKAVIEKMMTLLLSGLGLVAALAWNDAIQALFQKFFDPAGAGISAKFVYAVIITALITIISIRLSQYLSDDKSS